MRMHLVASLPESYPSRIAVDVLGRIYLGCDLDGTVLQLSPSGRVRRRFHIGYEKARTADLFVRLPKGSLPGSLAFDSTGDLFIANVGLSSVARVAADGSLAQTIRFPANIGVRAVACGNDETLLVLHDAELSTLRIGATSPSRRHPLPVGFEGFSLTGTSTGSVYVPSAGVSLAEHDGVLYSAQWQTGNVFASI